MTALLSELEHIGFPSSEVIGPSSFHCGQISGGVGYDILAPQCTATCSVRVAEDLPKIEQLIDDAVSRYENVHLKRRIIYPELYLDHDVPGMGTISISFGTDVPWLKGNHKRYLYGPGTTQVAHGANEQIGISELIESVQVHKRIVAFCLRGSSH